MNWQLVQSVTLSSLYDSRGSLQQTPATLDSGMSRNWKWMGGLTISVDQLPPSTPTGSGLNLTTKQILKMMREKKKIKIYSCTTVVWTAPEQSNLRFALRFSLRKPFDVTRHPPLRRSASRFVFKTNKFKVVGFFFLSCSADTCLSNPQRLPNVKLKGKNRKTHTHTHSGGVVAQRRWWEQTVQSLNPHARARLCAALQGIHLH